MTLMANVLNTVPVILTTNTVHLSDTLKSDISTFIIDVSYNFNHAGLSSTESISAIWDTINRIHNGDVANWLLTCTARFRAVNDLTSLGENSWDIYCESVADVLEVAPTPDTSSLDATTSKNAMPKDEILGHLLANPWLVFYLSIYLATTISVKAVK